MSPGHNLVVTIKIKSRNFSFPKVWCCLCCMGWFQSSWEVGWQDSSFIGLKIVEWRNSSDILEWGPDALQTGNITLIAPNHLWARIGYLHVPIAGNHRLSLLVHLSCLHHHSLGSIHLKLLSCWVESTHPFAVRVVDSRPSVLRHPSGGHNCKFLLQKQWIRLTELTC